MEQFIVSGMSCAACQARVEKAVNSVDGVTSCAVSLLTNSMRVEGTASPQEIMAAVDKAGYGARLKNGPGDNNANDDYLAREEEALKDNETPRLRKRLLLSVGFLLVLMYISMGHGMAGWPLPAFLDHNYIGLAVAEMLLAICVMLINRRFFTSGFSSLLHGAPNMDTLIALGSSVSFGWSVAVLFAMTYQVKGGADNEALVTYYHNEMYFESAAMILALITVGKMLEAMSKGKTTDALKSLMKLTPQTANVERDGREVTVDINEVVPGDIFLVRSGETVSTDGVIVSGSCAVDEAALTGESMPVEKETGDTVSGATINTSGFIKVRATRVGRDTTLAQIIQMVSDASATKAPIARIADRICGIFVPAVMTIAFLTVIGWLIGGANFSFALARGISVLVISCPCALGLATPVAIMVADGMGAKHGILFKTSQAMEETGRTQIVALDKTGTITRGEPEVTKIIPASGVSETELLTAAYALEALSEHPLAKAIVRKARERKLEPHEVAEFKALSGSGLTGKIDGKEIAGGSGKFIRTITTVDAAMSVNEQELAAMGMTPVYFAREGRIIGMIAAADSIKDESIEAIKQLKKMGITVVMLTGDNELTAKAIGGLAGIEYVAAGILPQGKEALIRKLKSYGKTVMVGDGINDAPALSRADIGIAIGAGTDIAVESADIVLMNSRLSDVAAGIRLSRAALRNIHENLFWAFFYNLICIPLAMGLYGWQMNPMIAAGAMSLSSFTVCMNALRLNLFDLYNTGKDQTDKAVKLPRDIFEEEKKEEEDQEMKKTLIIEGMMCTHCEATVEKALKGINGVTDAKANHEKGTAVVTLSENVDDEVLKKAVEDRDYTVKSVG